MLPSDIRGLVNAYKDIYDEKVNDDLSEELIEEIVEELVEECLEFGYTLDESFAAIEEAANLYFDAEELEEAKVTYGSDTESPEQRAERAKERLDSRKSSARRAAVKGAVERVGAKLRGARAAAEVAGSIAKDEARRAGRRVQHEVGKAGTAITTAAQNKKEEVKKGVKGLLKRGLTAVAGGAGIVAQKARKASTAATRAAERLGEDVEQIAEISADLGLRASRAADQKRAQLARSGDKPGAAAKAAQAARLYTKQAKIRMKKEDVDIFDLVLEYLIDTGHAETIDEAQYIMSQMDDEMIQTIVNENIA